MHILTLIRLSVVALAVNWIAVPAFAQSNLCLNCNGPADIDVLFFGGVMTDGDFPGWSMVPLAAPLEEEYLIGAAINREFADLGKGFHLGGELGVAGRFGDSTSAEFWAGPSLRHDGFKVGPVQVSFGLVMGLSVVTAPTELEQSVEDSNPGGDATLLYYLGPEIAVTFDRYPNLEFVFRTHHRSGAKNLSYLPTLGKMPDTSNANIFGVRTRF